MTEKKRFFTLGKRITLGIVLGILLIGIATVLYTYEKYKTSLESQLIETGTGLANTIAAQVDPDSIDEYLASGETDDAYYETRDRICTIVEKNNIEYAVVTKPTEEGFYYLYDTDDSDKAFHLGDFQEYYEGAFLDNKEKFLVGQDIDPIITNYEFGWLLSVLVPIKDNNGVVHGYVDIDMSMDEIVSMIREFALTEIIVLAIILVLMAVAAATFANNKLAKPINKLAEATGNFVSNSDLSNGDGEVITLEGMNTGDEIERLYDSVRKMEQDIYSYIRNLKAVTAEKERIGAELSVATKIQEDMLPNIFPPFPENKSINIYAKMDPAKEVGGDFYDFFLIDDHHLAVVIADVSGKGVPAALMMVIAKVILKYRSQGGGAPEEIMEYVNNKLCESNNEQFFVTCWLAIIDTVTGEAMSVNAGHERPAIRRKDGKYELINSKHGLPLAAMEGTKYRHNEFKLEKGDSIFVYTDGVTEATNGNNELFGEERLLEALNKDPDASPNEMVQNVRKDIDEFVGDAPQFDDITMLSFRLEDEK